MVGFGRARCDQLYSNAMGRLNILMLNRLDADQPHAGPTHCLTDGRRVHPVILVALHIRLNKLGGDQFGGLATAVHLTGPVISRSTGFHHNFRPDRDTLGERIEPFRARALALPTHLIVPIPLWT